MTEAVKMQVTMLMAVLVMMVATSVVTVDARLDFSQIFVTPEDTGGSAACCNLCFCTIPVVIPRRCRCGDVKAFCYEGCKDCRCTKSVPPQCHCADFQNFCYKSCTTTTKT